MNLAVAAYYGTTPFEKVSASATGVDVSDVLALKSVHDALQAGLSDAEVRAEVPCELVDRVKESSAWLAAWERGDENGWEGAIAYMKKVAHALPRQTH